MSVAPDTTVALQDRFSRELPEMAVRWQAETFPELRLLVLNEPLADRAGPRRRPGCAAPTGCASWSATWCPAAPLR